MLQSKGLLSKSLEDDSEWTRRMAEAESQVSHLEVILDQKEKENIHLREMKKPKIDPASSEALLDDLKGHVQINHCVYLISSIQGFCLWKCPWKTFTK